MVPLITATLMAYSVSNSMSLSINDIIIEIKNLPFLPSAAGTNTFHMTAKDLMNTNFAYLTKESKLIDIAALINQFSWSSETIPVVANENKK